MEGEAYIKDQAAFCKELAIRLEEKIRRTEFFNFRCGRTPLREETRRLRRELLELEKMME